MIREQRAGGNLLFGPWNASAARTATVLVTDAERSSALAAIRSLGRSGYRVVAAASEDRPHGIGFRSRFASSTATYPDPARESEPYVEALLDLVEREDVDLVMPVTDDALYPLRAERERFEGRCVLALPSDESFAIARDKSRTLALAAELGIDVPRTWRVTSLADVNAVVRELSWPIVVKPEVSREAVAGGLEAWSVSYARDAEELRARVAAAEGRVACLLQEHVAGEGHGVELLTESGRPLLAFQHRRLAEVPITGGASAWRESVALDPLLYEQAVRLLAALEWTGLAMVEFKVGERARLMEINGRIWGSLPLAVQCGVDFPARCADLFLGRKVEPVLPSYALLQRAHHPDLFPLWVANVLRAKRDERSVPMPPRSQALRGLFSVARGHSSSDLDAADDPGPRRGQWRASFGRQWKKWRRL